MAVVFVGSRSIRQTRLLSVDVIKLDDLCTYLPRLTQLARAGGPEGAWSVLRLGF